MSNFVSGGSLEEPVQRDDEWLKAQQELEETRRRKAELEQQHSGKTLYEVLQENKAKKQDAFEEATKLKNQFRSLDEDEIDFLDSVNETARAKEAAIRKETTEGLQAFRKHQEAAEKAALNTPFVDDQAEGTQAWAVKSKKRKQGREGLVKGIKLRKTSSSLVSQQDPPEPAAEKSAQDLKIAQRAPIVSTAAPVSEFEQPSTTVSVAAVARPGAKATTNALGLSGYSSDDDDD